MRKYWEYFTDLTIDQRESYFHNAMLGMWEAAGFSAGIKQIKENK